MNPSICQHGIRCLQRRRQGTGLRLSRRPLSSTGSIRYSPPGQDADSSQTDTQKPTSFVPKPTINIKHIRQNAELYSQNCKDRNYQSQAQDPYAIIELFNSWQELQQEARSMRQANNRLRTKLSHSKTFSGLEEGESGREGDREAILAESRALKAQLHDIEVKEADIESKIDELAAALPNITSDDTPRGDVPRVLGYINEGRWQEGEAAASSTQEPGSASGDASDSTTTPSAATKRAPIWRSHVHIGTDLDLLDFSGAAQTSGWGWYFLKNEAALLETALVQYATGKAREHGFSILSPPSMVYQHVATACGFRPRDANGESQIYEIAQPGNRAAATAKPTMVMAGTAEIPFASLRAWSDIEEAELPLLVSGSSRCYRAEAGAPGAKTKGLYRVHEFTKVEMFAWTKPDAQSANELFEKMVSVQKEVLGALGLYCRILEQPSADLGASATRKQDIEAWFPSRQDKDGGWGEVTSTSICTDYQTRRLGTRLRLPEGNKTWPYTINGTALAVPRVLAAILETHWNQEEGCVSIPEVLWPWMHGVKEIKKRPNDI